MFYLYSLEILINFQKQCAASINNIAMHYYRSETHMLVQGLEPNTKYEFAVRLHVDQLSSPWSPVVYHSTLPEGKASLGFICMLKLCVCVSFEDDTTLVPTYEATSMYLFCFLTFEISFPLL